MATSKTEDCRDVLSFTALYLVVDLHVLLIMGREIKTVGKIGQALGSVDGSNLLNYGR